MRVAGGAAAAALSRGYGLLHVPDPLRLGEGSYAMDGCVVVNPFGSDPVLTELLRRGLPIVSIDPDPDRPDACIWIGRNDAAATRGILNHIAALGGERFLLLLTTDDNAWKRGIRSAFGTWSRRRAREKWILEIPSTAGSEGARDAVRTLLRSGARPDALVGSTSRFVTGAIEALRAEGFGVPGQVLAAVLSDGELTRTHQPPITALDLHGEVLGKEAVLRLIDIVEGTGKPVSSSIDPTVSLRESTAQPLARRA